MILPLALFFDGCLFSHEDTKGHKAFLVLLCVFVG